MDKIKKFFLGSDSEESDDIVVTEPQQNGTNNEADYTIDNKHGWFICKCGKTCMDEYMYQIHCETTNGRACPYQTPLHPTGWSLRTFDFIPHVTQCQTGVIDHGKQHGLFVSLTLGDEFDDAAVRNCLSQIPVIAEGIMEEHDVPMVTVLGVENSIWRRWDATPPKSLRAFKERRAADTDEVLLPAVGGNMMLFIKCDRIDLCNVLSSRVIWALEDAGLVDHSQTIGFVNLPTKEFQPNQARDLTGFVDGTRNPDHLLRAVVDQTLIFPGDDEGRHVGGSFMYAGRYIHHLKKFHAMNNDEKSEIIGRDYSVTQAHVGYDQRAENARLDNDEYRNRGAREAPAPNRYHTNRGHASIYRQAMPYIQGKDQGLYFIAFGRTIDEFDLVLDRMAGKHQPDGSTDALFDISTAVSNNYYYCPSLEELENLPNVETIENPILDDEDERNGSGPKIIFEYCTNCGYKTIFLEKLKLIKQLCPDANILINPQIPRLASFEIYAESDGTIFFSKLSNPNGMNNYPECFPSNAELETNIREYFNLEPREYTDEEKENPTWGETGWNE